MMRSFINLDDPTSDWTNRITPGRSSYISKRADRGKELPTLSAPPKPSPAQTEQCNQEDDLPSKSPLGIVAIIISALIGSLVAIASLLLGAPIWFAIMIYFALAAACFLVVMLIGIFVIQRSEK